MNEIFLGREALRDGLSIQDLRRWYRPVFRGVYTPKLATLTLRDRAMAAWLYSDRTATLSGVVASALHGAGWVDDDTVIELVTEDHRRQPGLVVRRDRIASDEITEVRGLPLTTAARTAFDLGRYQKRATALGRLDALHRVTPFQPDEVMALMARYGPVRGVCQLRELLPLVDPGAASLQESRLRLLFIDSGFPMPETQIPVAEHGINFAYLDMGWQDIQLAVEYDGDQHRTDRLQYIKDIRRLPQIEREGWEVLRVVNEDAPRDILAMVYEAWLRRGGAEIAKMSWATRTFPSKGTFRREAS